MASKTLQAVRGMNDIFPEESAGWQALERDLRTLLALYAYGEVRLPLVESTELFARAIGDVTDIVQKEMYTFADRNGDSLTLRPEGTAGCVRAAIQAQSMRGQTPRYYYMGPMFRHERPQKGRYRQFYQLGVEVFGLSAASTDAEVIALSARILRTAGVTASLQINSLGSPVARANYRALLLGYLRPRRAELCADCQERMERNPLRVLDCKVPTCQNVAHAAPHLADHLDEDSAAHFALLQSLLTALDIPYQLNHSLVRGLDYYNRTVFEWVTDVLGAQGTVLAGGRYDGLVAQLGGADTPAIGFAVGLERLLALQVLQGRGVEAPHPLLFIGALEDAAVARAWQIAEKLRDEGISVVTGGPANFKNILKQAERSRARFQAIIGAEQLTGAALILKEQGGEGHWQGNLDALHTGLRCLGVDFPQSAPHTVRNFATARTPS
ncbi:histidine--tRNA ligase [Acidithiobacillus sp.]|jgi:histidyl-tRNA synthetase|uniref:histidine--tRNA ligase n=1 Tax=Acidithiobacillus sp. TaxID=1872118 RepID=UPI0025BE7624|nr:histidine--tRNA ligase [Acidithiobacillus sp.]MCK9187682.1 histidine--tRNA ligase [Acidithiobacillus sp.]MCK9358572.1 histidine--tRNA ligase [Acidithiobacillus sp.]